LPAQAAHREEFGMLQRFERAAISYQRFAVLGSASIKT